MQENIPPFQVSFSDEEIESFISKARDILSSGRLIPGTNNLELETTFADFIGTKYASAVISGTSALEIIFRCLDLRDAEVLVPANTNYATAEAVIRAGAKPRLYDSALYPELSLIEDSVSRKTRAIVIVHIGGYISPAVKEIVAYCEKNSIHLIEDASHAHGSKFNGQSAGTFGVAAGFSLFATKVLTTSEGGLITTSKESINALSKTYRDQGKSQDGVRNVVFGSAWRMSELHAALGLVQLQNFSQYLRNNNNIIKLYNKIDTGRIRNYFEKEAFYSGHKFIISLSSKKERESLKSFLLEKGISPAKGVYEVPLNRQPALPFADSGNFPHADKFAETHLCLPIWKGLSDKNALRIVETVNTWSSRVQS